jgi:egghead protein (zeste-white 4 protein)
MGFMKRDESASARGNVKAPRDWRLIALVAVIFTTSIASLYALQLGIWAKSSVPHGDWQNILNIAGEILWCLPVLAGSLSVAGMLSQRKSPPEIDRNAEPISTLVSFRFMSRGTNTASLVSAVCSVHAEMQKLPLFPYIVEVCVETPQQGLPGRTIEMVLPGYYQTPNGSLYKGRALQYAMEQSSIGDDAWIMHCDEESHIHESLIYGIYNAVREEEASGQHRIGQGAILYYNSLKKHPFLTLADSVRTGDDIGRFHLQNRYWGVPVWGFHGSFILVRNSVEKRVGFDFGPEGSITEDAFWALASAEQGARARWVDGFMVEQGTERIMDFIKQRRRWYAGLLKVVLHAPTSKRLRVPLAVFTAFWSVSWLAIIYTYLNYVMGWHTDDFVQAIGNMSFTSYVIIYVIGLRTNLLLNKVHPAKQVLLYAAQVLLIPVFALLESCGVLMALVRPETGFHVVQKRMQSSEPVMEYADVLV